MEQLALKGLIWRMTLHGRRRTEVRDEKFHIYKSKCAGGEISKWHKINTHNSSLIHAHSDTVTGTK